jgi:L-fuculose-phosphate aldolase
MANERQVRKEICEIGRRLYAHGFAAGNAGNISYRLSDNVILCTPTQICKGLMTVEDLCEVDMDGNQIAGKRKRTSEILMHLAIYQADPSAKAVVHCHPPHATAFGIARVDIPSCILPEVEVFLGVVPRADYETPGGQRFAETVRPFVGKANTVVLSNHGTVSWGPTVERAYWYTEILDSYCRMLMSAKQLGHVERLPGARVNELLDLKERFGAGPDPRRVYGGELCVNPEYGRGATGEAEAGAAASPPDRAADASVNKARLSADDFEALVKTITARVVEALRSS